QGTCAPTPQAPASPPIGIASGVRVTAASGSGTLAVPLLEHEARIRDATSAARISPSCHRPREVGDLVRRSGATATALSSGIDLRAAFIASSSNMYAASQFVNA